jgi:uncharacterized protein with von Willebrand factor type A (vWA) domain
MQKKVRQQMQILSKANLDEAVAWISDANGFPQDDKTYEAIATVILHAPPDMGSFDEVYIASRVAKMMANKAAYDALQGFAEKRKAESPEAKQEKALKELKQEQEETAKAAQAAEATSGTVTVQDKEVS